MKQQWHIKASDMPLWGLTHIIMDICLTDFQPECSGECCSLHPELSNQQNRRRMDHSLPRKPSVAQACRIMHWYRVEMSWKASSWKAPSFNHIEASLTIQRMPLVPCWMATSSACFIAVRAHLLCVRLELQ